MDKNDTRCNIIFTSYILNDLKHMYIITPLQIQTHHWTSEFRWTHWLKILLI